MSPTRLKTLQQVYHVDAKPPRSFITAFHLHITRGKLHTPDPPTGIGEISSLSSLKKLIDRPGTSGLGAPAA